MDQIISEPTNNQPLDEEMYGEYEVEKILGKKVVKGKTFYLTKWKLSIQGFQRDEYTWETEKILDPCAKLVEEFNQKAAGKEKELEQKQKDSECEPEVGFDPGVKPIKITDVSKIFGEVFFTIQCGIAVGKVLVDLVPAKEANEKCPQSVISFYEELVQFK